ncbi:MAG: hypothetical protein LUF28_08215 [Clostridiales bacterium]|nr:hypothetical protein [Clostridiales bacterium]
MVQYQGQKVQNDAPQKGSFLHPLDDGKSPDIPVKNKAVFFGLSCFVKKLVTVCTAVRHEAVVYIPAAGSVKYSFG